MIEEGAPGNAANEVVALTGTGGFVARRGILGVFRFLVRPVSRLPQLDVYAGAMVDNLRARDIKAQLAARVGDLIGLRNRGALDDVSFFLSIKAVEYQVISALSFNTRELGWFLRYDLLQTPAKEEDVERLRERFLGDEKAAPATIDASLFAKIIHVAVGQWQQYAETLQKAIQRERQISLYLMLTLLTYVAFLSTAGVRILLSDGMWSPWHWGAFVEWLTSTKDFACIGLGALGAVVSITLAERQIVATRPFDDLYQFWSRIPKLLIGMIAGLLAPSLFGVVGTFVNGIAGVTTTQAASPVGNWVLFSFAAGFSDRLFFDQLVKATWKKSGLAVSEKTE